MLRSRTKNNSTKWELKYPSKLSDLNKNVENYYELTDSKEIINAIFNLSNRYPIYSSHLKHKNRCDTIDSLIHLFDLKPYARINSLRKSYLFEENIRIDLDETDFNYRLGEIELILDEKTKKSTKTIDESIQKISNLTSTLGITNFDKIPGKISAYLYLFNPTLFELLIKNATIDEKVVLNLNHLFKK